MRAFITGISGVDGSLLSKLLLDKGYEVFGLLRRTSHPTTQNLANLGILDKVTLISGDLGDSFSLLRALERSAPHEVYHLGAQSYVQASFDQPTYTSNITGLGTLRLLDAIREFNTDIKFYNACSSEVYGVAYEIPQTEKTPFNPQSPYAAAKAFSYHIAQQYRVAYNLNIWNGICFNHEHYYRSEEFVTRKITKAVARIKHGLQDMLYLGNLDAKRDWGWAEDYVECMWKMLQTDTPEDYVVATEKSHSVQEFVERAFEYAGVSLEHVATKRDLLRPLDVHYLLGDAMKAHMKLNWYATVKFPEIVRRMVDHDLALVKKSTESIP